MSFRHLSWVCALSLLGTGCWMTTSRQVNQDVSEFAARMGESNIPTGSDLLPPSPTLDQLPSLPPTPKVVEAPVPTIPAKPGPVTSSLNVQPIQPVSFIQVERTPAPARRLQLPADLPGADAPPIVLPENKEERERFLQRYYPPIPPLPPEPLPAPGPEGKPLSLADLQRLAGIYSPAIKNAQAAIEASRGGAYDVGQYPNPQIAAEHDTVETGPAGYPGGFIDQLIKTGGKLALQQAAAIMDVLNAKIALRRAKADLRYQVRGYYFAVLVAHENARANEALYRFAEEIYQVQVSLLRGGFAAAYEPMQLRPLVLQAQLNAIQARNQFRASWRQLAAVIGLPDMPPAELEGQASMAVPVFDYDDVEHRLQNHTDVLTAQVSLQKSKYNLKLQRVQPMPDVGFRWLMQKDYSTPPNQIAHSAIMYASIPLWDQNRGGIRQAEWQVAQAALGPIQARNSLIVTLADAFNRYQTMVQTVEIARQQIRDQVRVYRGAYARRQTSPEQVMFADLVTAQQTLAGFISSYFMALGLQWQAVVDVANLLQTEELYPTGMPGPVGTPGVDIVHLLPDHAPLAGTSTGGHPEPMGPPLPDAPPSPAMLPSTAPVTSPDRKRGGP